MLEYRTAWSESAILTTMHCRSTVLFIITLVYLSVDFIPDGVGVVRASLNSLVIDIILFVSLMSDSDTAIHNQHNHGLTGSNSEIFVEKSKTS